jgi:hypothetical protein
MKNAINTAAVVTDDVQSSSNGKLRYDGYTIKLIFDDTIINTKPDDTLRMGSL